MVIKKIMSEEIKKDKGIEVGDQEMGVQEEGSNMDQSGLTPPDQIEAVEESGEETPAEEPTKKEKRRANELEVIEEATVETELEMLVKMWNEYNDSLKKDRVLELYMQGIFILNRGAQQIGLELGGLQQKIKGQIQFLNYLAGKIKLLKDQYEQNTK
jgi:hypothetical protein